MIIILAGEKGEVFDVVQEFERLQILNSLPVRVGLLAPVVYDPHFEEDTHDIHKQYFTSLTEDEFVTSENNQEIKFTWEFDEEKFAAFSVEDLNTDANEYPVLIVPWGSPALFDGVMDEFDDEVFYLPFELSPFDPEEEAEITAFRLPTGDVAKAGRLLHVFIRLAEMMLSAENPETVKEFFRVYIGKNEEGIGAQMAAAIEKVAAMNKEADVS